MSTDKPVIAISACLLGRQVRFNGGHKRDPFVTGDLSQYFDFAPLCPEVDIGLGVPRPPIRLVGNPEKPRAVGVEDASMDVTERLEGYARSKSMALQEVSGVILKKDSPSCGMERVKVYPVKGGAGERKGQGVFARVLMQNRPDLPIEEEGRMNDPVLRENFVNRVYVHQRWQQMHGRGLTRKGLIDFHTDHKYLVMAHSQAAYQRMGRMLSNLADVDLDRLADEYFGELMATLKRRVNRKRHSNVLQHIMGYLKKSLDSGDKAELVATIDAYRRGEVPLVVPITLLRHYFRRNPDDYMARQRYLMPHPEALGLRNRL